MERVGFGCIRAQMMIRRRCQTTSREDSNHSRLKHTRSNDEPTDNGVTVTSLTVGFLPAPIKMNLNFLECCHAFLNFVIDQRQKVFKFFARVHDLNDDRQVL